MQDFPVYADMCRKRAAEAERLARTSPDGPDAEALASIAFLWVTLEQRAMTREQEAANDKVVDLAEYRAAGR